MWLYRSWFYSVNSNLSTLYNYYIHAVHGFARAFYDVIEEEKLDTTFGLNAKGETSLPLRVSGVITSVAGTAGEWLYGYLSNI